MWSNDVQEVSTIGHVVVVGSPYHNVQGGVRKKIKDIMSKIFLMDNLVD